MPITIDDLPELLRLLREHPEWRDALRATLLTEELLQLPALTERRFAELAAALERLSQRVEELAARQAETEAVLARLVARVERLEEGQAALAGRMDRVEAALAELAQRQAETEARLAALAQRVEELAARQAETEARLAELAQRQAETEARLAALTARVDQLTQQVSVLTQRVDGLTVDVAELKQFHLEASYRDRAPAIFGSPRFRRVRALSRPELDEILSPALDDGLISWDEFKSVMEADLVVRGRTPETDQLYLVVEISWGIGSVDVERAIERAGVLRRAGFEARAAVAGRWLTPDADRVLDRLPLEQRPVVVYDGVIEWNGEG